MAKKAKKVTKRVAKPKVVASKEYVVIKSANISAMTKAYNEGYRRVGTYQGGAVAVLRNANLAVAN